MYSSCKTLRNMLVLIEHGEFFVWPVDLEA
ncbi:hypothetical protein PanWU01x14_101850 [Parasponia andersonii]|uniref:Uncharacterized protein n=1 Tax=Parasponia andersonii TaxID=3476 RepID=A0A2P5D2P6_PARAD|nr:hypothetical protein PanWU01x14_101850 [Parasponia andersonii]